MTTSHPPSPSTVQAAPPSSARSTGGTRSKRHSRNSSSLPSSSSSASSSGLSLTSVLGHTSHSPFAHSLSPATSELAYIAGNALLLYNHRTHVSRVLLTGRPSHSLSCCAFSRDGLLIATGETGGNSPLIAVYDASTGERRGVVEAVHAHSVRCIRWHAVIPSLLVSVGEGEAVAGTGGAGETMARPFVSELAMLDWRAGEDRASSVVFSEALEEPVHGLALSEDGTYAVTCGDKSLTYWNMTLHQDDTRTLTALVSGAQHAHAPA